MHRTIRFALALLLGALTVVPLGTAVHATETVTSKATVKNTPDDGCPAWARDTFLRTTTITGPADGKYKISIKDEGTFTTEPGAKTPGDATKTIAAKVTGTISGTGEFTVTGTLLGSEALAALDGKTYDNVSYDCKSDVPASKTTGQWPLKFFAAGATTTGIDPWKWTYTTACEKRTESSVDGAAGNITGKVCPSASPSVSAAPSVSNPAASPSIGAASLPVTGSEPWRYAIAGVLVLAVGALFVLAGRRRRKQFQA